MALVPISGELIDLSDTGAVASAVARIRGYERLLYEARQELNHVLLEESRRRGTKTLHLGKQTVTVSGGTDLVWDLDVLNELLDAGLPEDRWADLVTATVEYKVSSQVARQLEGASEVYAEIIGRARSRVPRRPTINVKEAT